MAHRRLVPDDFVVPLVLETAEFRLRPLTVNDLVKDYEAVMESVDHFTGLLSPSSPRPAGLTLEDDLIDLGWHQKEFRRRTSFAYTMMSLDARAQGMGRVLVRLLEARAREEGAQRLWLLTNDAEKYFRRLGYKTVDRAQAPKAITRTKQFAALCPASAKLMRREL